MIGTYGTYGSEWDYLTQLHQQTAEGKAGEDFNPSSTAAVAKQQASGGGGVGAGTWLAFIGQIVGAAGDIVGGITGVKAAKANAAATIEATRNQLTQAAIQYKGQALNAKLAPVLQAQQLAVKQAQTQAILSGVLVLGGGGLILALVLATRKPKRRKRRRKGRKK